MIFNKNKKINIEFIPSSKDVEIFVSSPIPSKNFIPNWYKSGKLVPKKFLHDKKTGEIINKPLKMCVPFLDSLTHGYIQESWCDIKIEKNENEINFYYSSEPKIMDVRDASSVKTNGSYYEIEFIWKMPWETKTLDGYSILITHPLNRIDLPFYTLSGIIDSDKFYHGRFGNLPFYIKKDFEGIIPAGTPLFQIIPIKRTNFKSKKQKFNNDFSNKKYYETIKNFYGIYKNKFWQKKEFN
jgi:hypothetical protein